VLSSLLVHISLGLVLGLVDLVTESITGSLCAGPDGCVVVLGDLYCELLESL
jgi:hypothetical protein